MSAIQRFTTIEDSDPFIAYDIIPDKEFVLETDLEPRVVKWMLFGVDKWNARHLIMAESLYSTVAKRYTRITGLPVALDNNEHILLPSSIKGEFVK